MGERETEKGETRELLLLLRQAQHATLTQHNTANAYLRSHHGCVEEEGPSSGVQQRVDNISTPGTAVQGNCRSWYLWVETENRGSDHITRVSHGHTGHILYFGSSVEEACSCFSLFFFFLFFCHQSQHPQIPLLQASLLQPPS